MDATNIPAVIFLTSIGVFVIVVLIICYICPEHIKNSFIRCLRYLNGLPILPYARTSGQAPPDPEPVAVTVEEEEEEEGEEEEEQQQQQLNLRDLNVKVKDVKEEEGEEEQQQKQLNLRDLNVKVKDVNIASA
ncbi:LOW QUALITY PROTEIN: hypothetical protein ElyMa_006446600 [Elysia marginata]|uniref:Uncharacterized protein n=1 Tax=Elysia marginata TaxID=1093978 RepID=A0AAV4HWD2_9GAST|nr:LOW QUALITY PROTEIN: hypothetical protein ElyMa_006446600 [Elysia marginata]